MAEPAVYVVERGTTIAAPPELVYDLIDDFRRWVEWSPWEGRDPTMQRTYGGPTSGAGATYSWKGNRKVGSGRMLMSEVDPPRRLEIAVEFLKPFKARNTTVFTLSPSGDATAVRWTMTGKKTLLTRIMEIFTSMDKMVGKDFEQGLSQLKTAAEGSRPQR